MVCVRFFFLSCLHRSEIQPPPSLCVLSCLSSIYYFIRHNFNLFLFFFFCFSFIFNYTSPFIITSSRPHLHPHLVTCLRSILDVLVFSLFFVCSFMLAFLNNTRNCDKQLRIIIKATFFVDIYASRRYLFSSIVLYFKSRFFFKINSS